MGVAHAMDLLMKCNRDGGKGHENEGDELGASYSPSDSENYNVGKKMSENAHGGDGAPPEDCTTKSIQNTIDNIIGPPTDQCKFHCSVDGLEYEAFTSDCNGSGQVDCFLTGTETYHRSVSASFLSWKAKCAAFHGENSLVLTELQDS